MRACLLLDFWCLPISYAHSRVRLSPHCQHTWRRRRVPSLTSDTEQNAEHDWWRAVCREEWLCKENSQPWMIYTVCFPVIISCSIITLYGFTRQKPGVIEVAGKAAGKKHRRKWTERREWNAERISQTATAGLWYMCKIKYSSDWAAGVTARF